MKSMVEATLAGLSFTLAQAQDVQWLRFNRALDRRAGANIEGLSRPVLPLSIFVLAGWRRASWLQAGARALH